MRAAWIVVAVGCGGANYRSGQIASETQAQVTQLGCLEVGVLVGHRPEATGPVVVVYLGNRCDHSVPVDLSALHVVGGDEQGATVPLVPYDPDREIGPRRLDGRTEGSEWIEYPAQIDHLAWLDVDVGAIALDEPIGAHWVRLPVPT